MNIKRIIKISTFATFQQPYPAYSLQEKYAKKEKKHAAFSFSEVAKE